MFAQGQLTRRNLKPAFASGLFTSARRKSNAAPVVNPTIPSLIGYFPLDTFPTLPQPDSVGTATVTNDTGGGVLDTIAAKISNGINFPSGSEQLAVHGIEKAFCNKFSLFFWAKGTGSVASLYYDGGNGPNEVYGGTFILNIFNTLISVNYLDADEQENTLSGAITNGTSQFHFVTLTYDGTTLKLYANATLLASVAVNLQQAYDVWYLGQDDGFFTEFNGVLDELGICNDALTLSEIQSLYNSGAGIRPQFPASPTPATFLPVVAQPSDAQLIGSLFSVTGDPNGANVYFLEYNPDGTGWSRANSSVVPLFDLSGFAAGQYAIKQNGDRVNTAGLSIMSDPVDWSG